MKLLTLNKNLISVPIEKYLIKWDKKSASNAQFQVKQFLKDKWQFGVVCEELRVPASGGLRVDFINFSKKIAVEVSGRQHENYVKFFHKNRIGFVNSIKRDYRKAQWLEINSIKLIEIYDHEVPNLSVKFIKEKFDIEI